MKSLISSLLLGFVLAAPAASQGRADGAQAEVNAAPLATENFTLDAEAEVGLELNARSPGASWARKGAEASALKIETDGRYNQDLLLWSGDERFTYRILLGRMAAGRHSVSVTLNLERSAAGARRAVVLSVRPLVFPLKSPSGSEFGGTQADNVLAVSHAPFLYARANTIDRFTDLPLLMYYELTREAWGDITIRYSVIFTNEDGGTPTAALMARWGRATDIEWAYEVRLRGGRVVGETYQGVAHETKPFGGERAYGEHPLLAVASDNNNFSDLACSAVRFAPLPVAADLNAASREVLMDSTPQTYRVMSEELLREGRIAAAPADVNSVADPREYLFVEAYAEPHGTAVSFEVALTGGVEVSRSDMGDARLRIDRGGYFRSAVRLPAGARPQSVKSVRTVCHATTATATDRTCQSVKLTRAFMLGPDYAPIPVALPSRTPATLKPGESLLVEPLTAGQQASNTGGLRARLLLH